MNLDETLTFQVLKLKSLLTGRGPLLEHLLDDTTAVHTGVVVRQMCAKVAVQLHDEVDDVCTLLSMSKREFIESAVADACVRARSLLEIHKITELCQAAAGEI